MNVELMRAEEVARLTGYKVSTLYQKVYNREIPFIRLNGKALRFVRADIEAWINQYRNAAEPSERNENV